MSDVEIRLGEPWRAPGIRVTKRNRPSRRIRGHIHPLVSAKYIHSFGDLLPEHRADVDERGLWATLVGSLEETKGRSLVFPGELVIHVALEGIRTIGRQGPIIRLAIGTEVVERLVERTARVWRVTSWESSISLVSIGQARIVTPQAAIGIAEHSGPAMTRGLAQPEFYGVIVTDRLGIVW